MDILTDGAARQRQPENAGASSAFDSICEEIKDDMKQIEADSKRVNFGALLDVIKDCIKCFIDSIKCCFKIKIE
jgi:hypothetical protein